MGTDKLNEYLECICGRCNDGICRCDSSNDRSNVRTTNTASISRIFLIGLTLCFNKNITQRNPKPTLKHFKSGFYSLLQAST